jgi:hypothetical protein
MRDCDEQKYSRRNVSMSNFSSAVHQFILVILEISYSITILTDIWNSNFDWYVVEITRVRKCVSYFLFSFGESLAPLLYVGKT